MKPDCEMLKQQVARGFHIEQFAVKLTAMPMQENEQCMTLEWSVFFPPRLHFLNRSARPSGPSSSHPDALPPDHPRETSIHHCAPLVVDAEQAMCMTDFYSGPIRWESESWFCHWTQPTLQLMVIFILHRLRGLSH